MIYNDPKVLTVFGSNEYDYERQMHTRQFLCFQRSSDLWTRAEAKRILRGVPCTGCWFTFATQADLRLRLSSTPTSKFMSREYHARRV